MSEPKPYDLTTYDGDRVDWLTRAALEATAKRLGYDLTITQGSYNAGGVTASAGTHDGGGVVDLAPYDHARKVLELRRTGFAAWYRPELWRDGVRVWPPHIHAVLMGNARLSSAARAQVQAYLAGKDGLAGNGPDNGPRNFTDRRFTWRAGMRRITKARALIARADALLATGVRGYPAVQKARARLGRAATILPTGDTTT